MSNPAAAPPPAPEAPYDVLVDEVLAAAGGDVRKAILVLVLVLVLGQRQLEAEASRAVSAGYVRRGLCR